MWERLRGACVSGYMSRRWWATKMLTHLIPSAQAGLKQSTRAVTVTQRSSARLRAQQPVNYMEHTARGQQTSKIPWPLSQHMKAVDHQQGDVQIKVVTSEQTRWRRQSKETLSIHRINPTLNEDDGEYTLPAIYTNIPRFSTRSSSRVSAGTRQAWCQHHWCRVIDVNHELLFVLCRWSSSFIAEEDVVIGYRIAIYYKN